VTAVAEEGERRVLETIDAAVVRRWAGAGVEALEGARDEIDGLNVYPVADGDTGTNLLLTVQAATEGLSALPADADLPTTTQALATGALLGARGSSGIILSQFFRGLAATFRDCTDGRAADGSRYAAALRRSADLAYAAVAHPVEGTMLTVARDAAAAAEGAGPDLHAVARAACDGARAALGRTPGQLEVLRRAGVVDAGGSGLCVLLDAMLAVVEGRQVPADAEVPGSPAIGDADGGTRVADPLPVRRRPEAVAPPLAYEVMYLLDADDESVRALTARLDALGDALAVVGGDGLWNVHVHVSDAGAAVEEGLAAGRVHQLRITALPPEDDPPRLAGPGGGGRGRGRRAGRAPARCRSDGRAGRSGWTRLGC
jgi:DAK2 domain fusion protein YloV